MKNFLLIATLFLFTNAKAQKLISDCTIQFSVKSSNFSEQKNLGSKIIYVKGKEIRIDLVSNSFNQTVFINNAGNVTVLKDIGQSKYISEYSAEQWKKVNAIYEDISVSFTSNTKNILNYECKEAILKLKNGVTYSVYYIPSIILSSIENSYEFKSIPGLILEYETTESNNSKVIYTAEKVDFNPVPSLQFKIPKSGYRVLHD